MSVLSDCTPKEREVFIAIANGTSRADECDPDSVQSLLNKNLLGDHSGYIMVPAIVLKLWENERETAQK